MTVLTDDTNYKAIADAIRAKNGTDESYKPSEMASAITAIKGGGSEDGVIDGSAETIDNDRVTFVRESAFYNFLSLTSVNLPNVTEIDYSAFSGCESLSKVNMPKLETVGYSAFEYCEALESISLPAATYIDGYAFNGCTNLTDIDMPNVETIMDNAFQDCTSLKTIYIPATCTTIDASASYDSPFDGCYKNGLHIYCGASSKPDGWGTYWNATSSSGSYADVTWGVTPEEYAAL